MPFRSTFLILIMVCFGVTVSAQKYKSTNHDEVSKTLGDSNFSSNKSLFENLKDAPDFTILSKILKNDQLRKSLENQEMVTIFAIADEAFMNLPKKSRDSILGNKPLLNAMIKYLAIPGRLDSHSLLTAIEKNGGKALLTTVEGQSLEIKEENGQVVLVDSYNNSARIIAPDYYHKNGFFHIVDGFVFPPGSN